VKLSGGSKKTGKKELRGEKGGEKASLQFANFKRGREDICRKSLGYLCGAEGQGGGRLPTVSKTTGRAGNLKRFGGGAGSFSSHSTSEGIVL